MSLRQFSCQHENARLQHWMLRQNLTWLMRVRSGQWNREEDYALYADVSDELRLNLAIRTQGVSFGSKVAETEGRFRAKIDNRQ